MKQRAAKRKRDSFEKYHVETFSVENIQTTDPVFDRSCAISSPLLSDNGPAGPRVAQNKK